MYIITQVAPTPKKSKQKTKYGSLMRMMQSAMATGRAVSAIRHWVFQNIPRQRS
jgi:hypothetical protein